MRFISALLIFASLTFGTFAFAGLHDCHEPDNGNAQACWDRCPWTFDTCASQCGGGSDCWAKCPWTFDTCAQTCGSNSMNKNELLKFLNTESLRAEREVMSRFR